MLKSSAGDDSLSSSAARGDEASTDSRRDVRSEAIFRSRYETNFGGSSPAELNELFVFVVIDELETVVGECDELFLEEDVVRSRPNDLLS